MSALVLALMTLSSHAGFAVGNGGMVIDCRKAKELEKKDRRLETLDLFEARVIHELEIDLGSDDLTVEEKAALVFERFRPIDPVRAEIYRRLLDTFWDETNLQSGITLKDTQDSTLDYIPKGCKLMQTAVQNWSTYEIDSYYFVRKDYWKKLDTNSRAALMIHEIVYRDAVFRNHRNSDSARYLAELAMANRLDPTEWVRQMSKLKMPVGAGIAQGGVGLYFATYGKGCKSLGLEPILDKNEIESLYPILQETIAGFSRWEPESGMHTTDPPEIAFVIGDGVWGGTFAAVTPTRVLWWGNAGFSCLCRVPMKDRTPLP